MAEMAFAFLDCEFGGLDPELHDITEVGVIVTDYRLVELAEGQWRVRARPERITAEAAEMFGYDAALWAVAPGIRQVLGEVAALLPPDRKVVPAGQNVRMDVMFLERAYKQCGVRFPFDYHVIDLATLYYAWTLVTGEAAPALSLRQAATTAGLLDGRAVAHRALADARLTLECFRHYVGRLAPRDPAEVVGRPAPRDPAEVVGRLAPRDPAEVVGRLAAHDPVEVVGRAGAEAGGAATAAAKPAVERSS